MAEETARNKANVTLKLRKAEDDAADLRDANDELKQLLEKSEKVSEFLLHVCLNFKLTIELHRN